MSKKSQSNVAPAPNYIPHDSYYYMELQRNLNKYHLFFARFDQRRLGLELLKLVTKTVKLVFAIWVDVRRVRHLVASVNRKKFILKLELKQI